MGTPDFALASLKALIEAECNIVGVITAPDKPAGRGMKIQESAVKKYAAQQGLKILQPGKLKDNAFVNELGSLQADLQVVVAFRMLPEVVWNMPPLGTINVHASLLPQYRGAAPINWAIINGEKETGITTFRLKHEIDTGDILLQEKVPIGANETAGELHDRLMQTGARLLVRTIREIAEGKVKENSQDDLLASPTYEKLHIKHAPKIFTDTCKIDFRKSVTEVHNLIRGLSPFPGAFTHINGKMLKIYRSEKEFMEPGEPPGSFTSAKKGQLKFACTDGYIIPIEVQLEGKKRMMIEDFMKGYRFH